jgi:hypothetical protein
MYVVCQCDMNDPILRIRKADNKLLYNKIFFFPKNVSIVDKSILFNTVYKKELNRYI